MLNFDLDSTFSGLPRNLRLGREAVEVADDARLETFPNPARRDYMIRFETDDFTSLCPVTGQADFARLQIESLVRRQYSP